MKKLRNKQKTIELILTSAIKIFSEKGYNNTTVDDVVKAVNFTKGAFYCHFESKEELFLAIIDYRVATQQKAFQEKLQINATLAENIHNLFQFMLKMTAKENWVPLYIEFLTQSTKNDAVQRKMAMMYNNWINFLSMLLQKLKAAGLVSKDLDIGFAASALIAVFDGFNIQALVEPDSFQYQKIVDLMEKILSF